MSRIKNTKKIELEFSIIHFLCCLLYINTKNNQIMKII